MRPRLTAGRATVLSAGIGAVLVLVSTAHRSGEQVHRALATEYPLSDEPQLTEELIRFLKVEQERRYPAGEMKRFAHPKHLGCADGELVVEQGLPEGLRKGLLASPRRYPAVVRFGNNRAESDAERDLRGASIKVFGTDGPKLLDDHGAQDFVLISHPVLVAGTTRTFYELLRAVAADRPLAFFLNPLDPHLRELWITLQARQHPTSHLDLRYWSTTPYLLGEGQAVKYSLRPCSPERSAMPAKLTENYLVEDLTRRLDTRGACFELMVQRQVDPDRMPIEDASVEWDEELSPFIKVATLQIPRQRIGGEERRSRCEQLSFNPWHTTAEHRPLGSINRARRDVYQALSEMRQHQNIAASP